MGEKSENRWLILAASIIMNLCIGSAYAWSIFQKPLIAMFDWTTAQASLAFTLNLSLVPIAMIFAGRIQDRQGPKKVTFVGGLIFGAGIILAGFTNSLTGLYLTYGVLGGFGIGTVYACTVANTVKWFPDKRGLAGGLTAAGFGFGAVVFAPVAVSLIENYTVLPTFRILGFIFMVAIILCSMFLKAPQAGWKPEGWQPKVTATTVNTGQDCTASEMTKTPKFYILWAMYTIGCIAGLMIIGHASPIGQEKIGLSPQVAAYAVSFLGLANTFGRIFWGSVSDKIGRYNAVVLMYIVSSVMLMLLFVAKSFGLFIIAICGIALSFGGFMGIFPSITADNFGAKNLGINYGVMFTAFGLAAFFGPRIAAVVKQSSGGDYGKAFLTASALNIIGIVCTLIINSQLKKQRSIADAKN
ncbi:L-lactate MFS transporter [Anaerosolibacter sp.]|uniref:L-lactate MFS transporter n=1 Tax=Anaerosolibacter sp. TaxID=1872527 RepID=UPI0039EF1990